MYLLPQIKKRGDKVQDEAKQAQEVMAKRTAKTVYSSTFFKIRVIC